MLFGNRDGFQAATAIKRITADARHAVGNGDGCQAATATVFTIRFISTILHVKR